MKEIYEYLLRHTSDIIGILAALGIVFEITPIKINPISSILKWIGKQTNKELNEKIDQSNKELVEKIDVVKKELGEVKKELYHSKKKQGRILISNFANDLRHGQKKTESQYIAIMDLVHEYLENGWNSKIQMEAIFIKEAYKEFLEATQSKGVR